MSLDPFSMWLTNFAAVLAADPRHTLECDLNMGAGPCNCDYHPSVLEQRIAIGLIQSRALECRHWADVLIREHPNDPIAIALARHLARRSHKLEQLGLDLCKEGVWPIKGSTQEPKVRLN